MEDLGLGFSSVNPLFALIHGSLAFAEFAENPSLDFGRASPSSMLFLTSVPKELLACGVEPWLVTGLLKGDLLTDGEGPISLKLDGLETVDIELLAPPGLPKGDLEAKEPILFSDISGGVDKLVGPKLGLAKGDLGAKRGLSCSSIECLGVVLIVFSEDFDLLNGGLSSSCAGGVGLEFSTTGDDDSSPLREYGEWPATELRLRVLVRKLGRDLAADR